MKMNLSKIAATLAVGLLLPIAAHAQTYVCPVAASSNASLDGDIGGITLSQTWINDTNATAGVNVSSCNELITFGAGGAISTASAGAGGTNASGAYDSGGDDNIVGIYNNSGSTLTSITLTASTDIFGFDGDGICAGYSLGTATGDPGCGTPNSSGYGPGSVLEASTSGNNETGTITFVGGLQTGDYAFFSLEDAVTLNAQGVTNTSTPEPSSLMLLGTGVLGMAGMLRRRIVNAVR